MPESPEARLEELERSLVESQVGFELRQTATQLVFGEGSVKAHLALIGEAPGKQEDLQGRPFVGASGRFLDEMLAAAGLTRKEVYITNIVKYRPPNNRDPRPEEIAEFWPYLLEQIKIIQPELVLTLGRFSMNCFLPDAKISQQHGQAVEYYESDVRFKLVPLYHPAAALYNGSMRQVLTDDFTKAASIYEEGGFSGNKGFN